MKKFNQARVNGGSNYDSLESRRVVLTERRVLLIFLPIGDYVAPNTGSSHCRQPRVSQDRVQVLVRWNRLLVVRLDPDSCLVTEEVPDWTTVKE